ncbi:flagellar hook-length control protein FliK [Geobacter argillaceus]|uniref:Flagellar hook-length control protein FliK n=1 Tax=Geobacter argillaceus TaxID=345631 RepID=A0A562W8M1_9BACT|nr:flagellar hook-length control protein FliK [Geobacter argillaceus]TWJ26475.1 flagellar hook-length control protein FliK [Geobacter argillaceus]
MELSTDIIILLKSPTIGEAITPVRVSAIPSAILQLAPGTDVRAEVLGRMANGRTLMRVAGEVLTMELPESLATADSVRMTFLGREPRPTFSLSLRQNSATPVAISQTGRWLGQIVQGDTGTMSRPEQLGRSVRLSDGPPVDTARLAASLREALTTSGLFYESHLVEWAAGKRQLSSIMQEPQASLSPQPAETPAPPLSGNEQPAVTVPGATKGTESAAQPSQPAPGSASATQQPPAAASPLPETPTATEAAGAKAPLGSGEGQPEDTQLPSAPQPGRAATTSVGPSAGELTVDTGRDSGTGTVPQPAGTQPAAIRPGAETSQQTGAAPTAPPPAAQTPFQQQVPSPPVARSEMPPPENGIIREQPTTASLPALHTETGAISSSQQPASSRQKPLHPLQHIDPVASEEMNAPASALSAKPTHEASTGRGAERPEVADPRAASIIKEQLSALNSGIVTWNGEAWPGQPLQWKIEDREARHREASEGRWHSELRVDLPNLGNVVASLKIRGKKLHLSLTADAGSTTDLMQQEAPNLEERLAAAGLNLENMVIRHGKKE